jgi:hypothetical protein
MSRTPPAWTIDPDSLDFENWELRDENLHEWRLLGGVARCRPSAESYFCAGDPAVIGL